MRSMILLVLAASMSLAGCANNCKKACDNVKAVCGTQFEAAGKPMDVDACVKTCEENLDGCKNLDDQESCLADAKTCAEVGACPGCVQ